MNKRNKKERRGCQKCKLSVVGNLREISIDESLIFSERKLAPMSAVITCDKFQQATDMVVDGVVLSEIAI